MARCSRLWPWRVGLSAKIGGLSAVLLAMGVFVTSHFLVSTRSITDQLDSLAGPYLEIVHNTQSLKLNHERQMSALREIIGGSSEIQNAELLDGESGEAITGRLLSAMVEGSAKAGPEERLWLNQLHDRVIRYREVHGSQQHRLENIDAGTSQRLMRLAQELINNHAICASVLDELSDGSRQLAAASRARALRAKRTVLKRSFIIGVVSLLVSAVLALMVTRRLVTSVRALTAHAIKVARGLEIGQSRYPTFPVASTDEVGQLADSFNRVVISLTDNIARRRSAEDQLTHDSVHDPLTGLPNRYLFTDRLRGAVERRQREGVGKVCIVLMLDVDRFALINEAFGQRVGDQVLRKIAIRLQRVMRNPDTLARVGGDEFAIVIEKARSIEEALFLGRRLQTEVGRPIDVAGESRSFTLSIGIAAEDQSCGTADELMDAADVAMVRAQSRGQGHSEVFDAEVHKKSQAIMQLHSDLNTALSRGDIQVYYQPIVAVGDGRITGFEALARWNHPTRGAVRPSEFIPMAERTGLIVPLGSQILHQACMQTALMKKQLPDRGAGFRTAVNLSTRQLTDESLVDEFDSVFKACGVSGADLTVEITESAFAEDPSTASSILGRLADRGVEILIDDFGTGYASMTYLQRFPSDGIKIDKSFVGTMIEDSSSYEIVRATVALAHHLKKKVVAEGVEREDQFDVVRNLGCDFAQGFLFGHPDTADSMFELAASGQRWAN